MLTWAEFYPFHIPKVENIKGKVYECEVSKNVIKNFEIK